MIQEGRSRLQRGLKSRRLALAARPPAHARLTTQRVLIHKSTEFLSLFLLWHKLKLCTQTRTFEPQKIAKSENCHHVRCSTISPPIPLPSQCYFPPYI